MQFRYSELLMEARAMNEERTRVRALAFVPLRSTGVIRGLVTILYCWYSRSTIV